MKTDLLSYNLNLKLLWRDSMEGLKDSGDKYQHNASKVWEKR